MSKVEIVKIARQILSGERPPFEGCRAIVSLQGSLNEAERSDPDWLTFVGVESETDDLPTTATRHLWDAEALAEQDRRAAAYLQEIREVLATACKSIIERFSK